MNYYSENLNSILSQKMNIKQIRKSEKTTSTSINIEVLNHFNELKKSKRFNLVILHMHFDRRSL